MDKRWNLTPLYSGFDAAEFLNDIEQFKAQIKVLSTLADDLKNGETAGGLDFLNQYNQTLSHFDRLYNFAQLTYCTDVTDEAATTYQSKLMGIYSELTPATVAFNRWLTTLENFDQWINSDPTLKAHGFFLNKGRNEAKYLLSGEEELLIARLKQSGSDAWSNLQMDLTAGLLVPITLDGKEQTLPLAEIRNLAYHADQHTRKTAYEAELEGYKQIDRPVAAALNGIKGEVITLGKRRGYESALEQTLIDSNMDRNILDTMNQTVKRYLPQLQEYFLKKAKKLGHEGALPYYDLSASVGASKTYSYDEAKNFIIEQFNQFDPRVGDFATRAFDEAWIDLNPRQGKIGGAFCCNVHTLKESRILSNFTGTFEDVITLAHELGHGYHNECAKNETYLNNSTPMPLAETASIFCETLVKQASIKDATGTLKEELIEADLDDAVSLIVDIYSRFRFETELFNSRAQGPLSVAQINQLMENAQLEAYGSALETRHPYMWLVKPHYYEAGFNYYNFPYTFGLLFARGIYALYEQTPAGFPDRLRSLLASTAKGSIKDVATSAGIDLTDQTFWEDALKGLVNQIKAL